MTTGNVKLDITYAGLILLVCGAPLSGQTRVYGASRIAGTPPTVDGLIDDACWREANWDSSFVQREPYDGHPATERTKFALQYDDGNLYIAIRAYDSEPTLITRRAGRRDDVETGDLVAVMLDSYHDRRTAFAFAVTAASVRVDAVTANDVDDFDFTWNPIWSAETAHDSLGWTVEARIPLDQLRFGGDGELVWGLQVGRHLYRKLEWSYWQPMSRVAPGFASLFGELHGLQLKESRASIEVLPHALARLSTAQSEPDNPFKTGHAETVAGGLDVKVRSSSNFSLDLTVNPDFGQVEADPSMVNLTAFETRFEERRPFFIEGAEILQFDLPGSSAMENTEIFYSRRIGRAPRITPALTNGEFAQQPEGTTILGAAKLTGRTADGLSVGVMNAVTARERSTIATPVGEFRSETAEPLANYLVTRIVKDADDGDTVYGGVVTAVNRHLTTDNATGMNRAAYTGGFNFSKRWLNRTYFLELSTAFSHIRGDTRAISLAQLASSRYFQRPDADHLTYDSTRTSLTGHGGSVRIGKAGNSPFIYNLRFNWRSPGLELNDLGFLRHADLIQAKLWLGYFFNEPTGILREASIAHEQLARWDFAGRRTFLEGYLQLEAQFMNSWAVWTRLYLRDGAVSTRALRGGPAMRFEGSREIRYNFNTDDSRSIVLGVGGSSEWSNDGLSNSHGAGVEVLWRPSETLSLSLAPEYGTVINDLQWVTGLQTSGINRFISARLSASEFRFVLRVNYAPTPDFTVQYFGQPFVSAGNYTRFKRISDPMNDVYEDRFKVFSPAELSLDLDADANRYYVSETDTGVDTYSFEMPDFNVREFRSNLVVRWEYLPGSTLFLVWSQDRASFMPYGTMSLGDDLHNLFQAPADNTFLLKVTYWLKL
jgi:hypothetical protein